MSIVAIATPLSGSDGPPTSLGVSRQSVCNNGHHSLSTN